MLSPFGSYLAEREPATHALASAFRVCGGVLSGCVLDVPWPGQALGASPSRGALGSVPNPARHCSSWWTLTREMCFRHEASPCRCVRTNQDPLLAWCRPGACFCGPASSTSARGKGAQARRPNGLGHGRPPQRVHQDRRAPVPREALRLDKTSQWASSSRRWQRRGALSLLAPSGRVRQRSASCSWAGPGPPSRRTPS